MSSRSQTRKVKRKKSRKSLTCAEIADRHLSNFELYQQQGDIRQSFSSLSSALSTLPSLKEVYCSSFLEVFESWSTAVEEDYGFQEAVKLFEVALKHYPDSPDIKYLLAKILYRHGNTYEGWSYACLAHGECSQDPNAQETRGRLANALVERWHIPMLNDAERNSTFKQAIEIAVKEGLDEVLDIGAGTGLLSIFAKGAGAKRVYGCEVDKFMFEIASNVLKSNSNTRDIELFNLHSLQLSIPTHLPKRVSLVVTETVDAGLFGEHILATLQHAWAYLLLPPPPSKNETLPTTYDKAVSSDMKTLESSKDFLEESKNFQRERASQDTRQEEFSKYGRVIPSNAEVFVAVISCRYIAKCTKLKDPNILRYFNNKEVLLKLNEPYMSEKLSQIPGGFQLLSEWTPLTKIDFNSYNDINLHLSGVTSRTLELKCIEGGDADALALSFNLHLDKSHCISTLPSSCSDAWENAIYPVHLDQICSVNDIIKVDFSCCGGIINLCIQPEASKEMKEKLFLPSSGLSFLTSKNFMAKFLRAAEEAALLLKQSTKKKSNSTFVVCDITPFPIAGLSVLSLFSNVVLYVEEECIQKSLSEVGVIAKLTEDLEEEVDLLFLWPVTKEGTLQDGILKKILMYRLMMAEEGIVFPGKLDLIVDAVDSPLLTSMTRVDDINTCGIKVAEVFNIAKTNHHVDVHLDTFHHTSVLSKSVTVLQLSLTSGNVESLGVHFKQTEDEDDMLTLGGDIITIQAKTTPNASATLNAIPYWFVLSADLQSPFSYSTREQDSPCKQSIFLLDNFIQVTDGVPFDIRVIWRDGVFWAGIQEKF